MAALILATATAFHAKAPPPDTPLFLPNTYLVEARVVDVDKKTSAADLVIERVYAGDNALKGRKFTITDHNFWPGTIHGHPLFTPLVKGEVGLWWVGCAHSSARRNRRRPSRFDQSNDKLFSYNDGHEQDSYDQMLFPIYFPFPAILDGAPVSEIIPWSAYGDLESDPEDFGPNLMLEWADAIKKLYNTTGDDKRIALLKTYAGSDNPPLSAWALNALSRFLEPEAKSQLFDNKGEVRRDVELLLQYDDLAKRVRKDVKAILEDFADDPKLSICAQTELDSVLTRIDDDWQKSDRRAKMLQRWKKVKDPVDRYFIEDKLKPDASK